jgi:flagellar motor protein MotB
MGQEVIIILMAVGLIAALMLIFARLSPAEKCIDPANMTLDECSSVTRHAREEQVQKDRERDQITQVAKEAEARATSAEERTGRLEEERDRERNRTTQEAKEAEARAKSAEDRTRRLEDQITALLTTRAELPDKPRILNLTEGEGFHFVSGSAELGADFEEKLQRKIVPQIVNLSATYHANVIEIIGHTDGVPVKGSASTMDLRLVRFVNSKSDLPPLIIDNVGLGMARAASVLRVLRSDARLAGMILLPLSAGQTTDQNDQLVGDNESPASQDEQRRRIEIRLRRNFTH